jgi:fructokinase
MVGAVETGGTRIRCAWGTGPHDHRAFDEFATTSPQESLQRITAFFAAAPRIARLGVATFGPVELDPAARGWGRLLATPKPGWTGAAIGPNLAERLGVAVVVDTDVNAAALAEARWGAGRDADPVVYLTVGTGIGLGAIVHGRPLHGLLHPEAGHLRIAREPGDDFAGVCPFHGGECWEGLASGPAIAARWEADPSALPEDHAAWDLEARYIASGLVSVTLVLAPECIVLGGGVGRRAGLLDAVRRALPAALEGALDRAPAVVAPDFGGGSGLAGAFALAGACRA